MSVTEPLKHGEQVILTPQNVKGMVPTGGESAYRKASDAPECTGSCERCCANR